MELHPYLFFRSCLVPISLLTCVPHLPIHLIAYECDRKLAGMQQQAKASNLAHPTSFPPPFLHFTATFNPLLLSNRKQKF